MTERIGRYELVKTLAEGDRGKLYLARSTGFGGFARHVVIKTFEQLPGAAEGSFIEETLDLGRLHHQHINPVLDVGREGERFYVVLDFVHGRSAREVWHQTFTLGALLPLDFAFTVAVAAASGLHHAHTRHRADGSPLGLVHGHVSLSNIVIGFDGAVQLLGFAGASTRGLRASDTQLGFSKDQLAYLAPEQARRIGLDARSDVFALGVVLYELTTMRRAFRDDSDRLTIERVKIASYVKPRQLLPDYPPELERIITRALQIDPDARYQSAELMRRELEAVAHHMGLVLGDAAIVEVLAQLFDDAAADPWTSAHADTTTEALLPDEAPAGRRKPLRAATETVDALAIELEIPIEQSRAASAPAGARADDTTDETIDLAADDDTRATMPTPAVAEPPSPPRAMSPFPRAVTPPPTPPTRTTPFPRAATPPPVPRARTSPFPPAAASLPAPPARPTPLPAAPPARPTPLPTAPTAPAARTTPLPTAPAARTTPLPLPAPSDELAAPSPESPPSSPASMIDTDGVPVLNPLPTPAARHDDTPPPAPSRTAKPVVPPAPRRRIDYRIVAVVAALAAIGITTAVALALRGVDSPSPSTSPGTNDGAVAVAVDAPLIATTDAAITATDDAAIGVTTDAVGTTDATVATTSDAAIAATDAALAATGDAALAADAAPATAATTVHIRITTTPPNATVLIDGKRLGKTPFEGTVDRADGKHTLKVRLTGFNTMRVDVDLTADVVKNLVLVRAGVDAGAPSETRPATDLEIPD